MNSVQLEESLTRLLLTKRHIEMYEKDPLLVEDFEEGLQELQMQHGQYLNDLLFDIYDEYCEDDPCPDFIDFLKSETVVVHPKGFPNEKAHLSLLTAPFRFKLSDPYHNYEQIIWKTVA